MHYRLVQIGFVSALALLTAGKAEANTYSLTGIGTLGGSGSASSGASSDGTTVIGISQPVGNGTWDAFLWRNGQMTDIASLGGTTTVAYAVSADGSTVAGYGQLAGNATIDGFVYRNGVLSTIAGFGGATTEATVVSSNGSVVAGYSQTAGGADDIFTWSNGVTTNLGNLGGSISSVTAISANGSVIAGASSTAGGNTDPYIWSNGSFTDLGSFGGTAGTVKGLSADGTTAVGYSYTAGNASFQAFMWKNGVMTNLGTVGGTDSQASGISADGSTIYGISQPVSNATFDAFVYKGGIMTDIGNLGGTETVPTAASANGSVVTGIGYIAGNAAIGIFRWTQATGLQTLQSILTQNNINYTGWNLQAPVVDGFTTHTAITANGNTIIGTATYNGNPTPFIFYDNEGVIDLTTPQQLMQDLAPSTYATHQIENFFTASASQSLVASQNVMSSFASPAAAFSSPGFVANPQNIEPAAGGDSYNPLLLREKWSAYALGSFGVGQSNDFGDYDTNGTTGLFARVTDDLAVGAGLLGATDHTDLQLDGKMDVKSYGVALNAACEKPSGLRVYGTASISTISETIDRNYMDASTLSGSHGETRGFSYGFAGRAGYQMPLHRGYSIMPYAELDWGHTQLNAYMETGGAAPGSFTAQNSNIAISRIGAEIEKAVTPKIDVRGRAAWGHNIDAMGSGVTVTAISLTESLPYSAGGQPNWIEGGFTGVYKATASTHFVADLGWKAGDTPEPDVTATFGVTVGF